MRCWHIRKNDPLKCCHVYNFFFKKPYVVSIKKKKKKPQAFIKTPTAYPQNKKRKRTQSLKPKPYFPIKIQTQTCNSSLHLHIHTDRTSVFQPIKQTKKENLYNSENLCSCFAIVKTENLCSSFATTGDLEAILSLLFNNWQFRR